MRPWTPLILSLSTACSSGALPTGLNIDEPVPDFSLIDENETSATYSQAVSPRDYTGVVSAWYFGHSS